MSPAFFSLDYRMTDELLFATLFGLAVASLLPSVLLW